MRIRYHNAGASGRAYGTVDVELDASDKDTPLSLQVVSGKYRDGSPVGAKNVGIVLSVAQAYDLRDRLDAFLKAYYERPEPAPMIEVLLP